MESSTTPGGFPAEPGNTSPASDPSATPSDPPEDPASRTPEQDAEHDAAEPTPGQQEGDPIEQDPGVGNDNPDAVHRTSPPPADWQSGEPSPQVEGADRAVQTAGGSTDGLSVGTTADNPSEGGQPAPEEPGDAIGQ